MGDQPYGDPARHPHAVPQAPVGGTVLRQLTRILLAPSHAASCSGASPQLRGPVLGSTRIWNDPLEGSTGMDLSPHCWGHILSNTGITRPFPGLRGSNGFQPC